MYQSELFSNVFKGQVYLGGGCVSEVYALDSLPGYVIKRASWLDGTLNYLEWCQRMQQSGNGMRGMPEIDFIVHTTRPATEYREETRGYVVCMKRYSPHDGGYFVESVWQLDYMADLIAAYRAFMGETFGRGCDYCSDLHGGNVMLDGSTYILTDPSAIEYKTLNGIEGYTLQ